MRISRGFTLIEMLIVIMILGILYSIAAVIVSGMQNEARMARANGDLKTLELAINSYLKNYGECPAKDNYQRTLIQARNPLVHSNLFDPFGATANTLYSYDASEDHRYYIVFSVGAKRDGGSTINNGGIITIFGSIIYKTNGYLQ